MPQRPRFNGFGSVGSAMTDEITQILMEQEALKQQEFLNSLKSREAAVSEDRQRQNADFQRAQLEALAETRAAAAAERRSRTAGNLAETLTPGTELDESSAGALTEGGMGALVKTDAPSASVDVTNGLGASTADNPLGLSKGGGARMIEGRSRFTGTAKQNKEAADRAARLAWIKAQPDSPIRRQLEAQLMTGDNSLPLSGFEDPNQEVYSVDPESGKPVKSGTVPRGSRVVVQPRDPKPDKPNAPQIFYDQDGKPHAIQFGPAGAKEVALPDGLTGKIQPKPAGKTPEQIQAEAKARAAGTAEGKAGTGGGGLFSAIGSLLRPQTAHAPAAGGAAPKVGDTKKFPNGKIGVYDGTGWVQQ